MNNDELFQKAMDAINELFSDTSVTTAETRASLEILIEEIQTLLSTLPED